LFPVRCFSTYFTFLPLGDASVCGDKTAAPGEKSLCVLEYHTSKSVGTVQRAFCAKYVQDPPTDKTIRVWYEQFTDAPMLTREYRIDVCRVTRGAHIEHF
jgi:hypothetical protein